jgi:hypothetical protein
MTLRLLYLIFHQLIGWLALLAHGQAAKNAGLPPVPWSRVLGIPHAACDGSPQHGSHYPQCPPAAHCPAHSPIDRSASNCRVRSPVLPLQTGPSRSRFQTTRVSPGAQLIQHLVEGGVGGRGAAGGLG